MPGKTKSATASQVPPGESGTLPDLDCACASVRRAARLVTQLYGREMGKVEPSQFMLLSVLKHRAGCGQAPLGRALGFDKTTLSRNLSLMRRNGWIELAKSDDKRERGYRLTSSGEEVLATAKPGWKRAQEKLRAAMTSAEWETMWKVFAVVARAAQGGKMDH